MIQSPGSTRPSGDRVSRPSPLVSLGLDRIDASDADRRIARSDHRTGSRQARRPARPRSPGAATLTGSQRVRPAWGGHRHRARRSASVGGPATISPGLDGLDRRMATGIRPSGQLAGIDRPARGCPPAAHRASAPAAPIDPSMALRRLHAPSDRRWCVGEPAAWTYANPTPRSHRGHDARASRRSRDRRGGSARSPRRPRRPRSGAAERDAERGRAAPRRRRAR